MFRKGCCYISEANPCRAGYFRWVFFVLGFLSFEFLATSLFSWVSAVCSSGVEIGRSERTKKSIRAVGMNGFTAFHCRRFQTTERKNEKNPNPQVSVPDPRPLKRKKRWKYLRRACCALVFLHQSCRRCFAKPKKSLELMGNTTPPGGSALENWYHGRTSPYRGRIFMFAETRYVVRYHLSQVNGEPFTAWLSGSYKVAIRVIF